MNLIKNKLIILFLLLSTFATKPHNIDLRIAGFIPSSKLFRQIYGSIKPSYQLEASWNINNCIKIWSNFSYVNPSGRSLPLKVKTRLQLIPISLGFKYRCCFENCFDLYAGLGLCYSWIKEKNCERLLNKSHNIGGIIKFGIEKQYKCLSFSFFADYMVQNFKVCNSIKRQKVNASGLSLGMAIGILY